MQSRFSDSSLDLALPCFSFEVDGFTMIHLKDMNYFWTESPNLKESFRSLKQHPNQKNPTVFSFFKQQPHISFYTTRVYQIHIKSKLGKFLLQYLEWRISQSFALFWIWEFDVWRGDCDWLFSPQNTAFRPWSLARCRLNGEWASKAWKVWSILVVDVGVFH